MVCGFRYTVVFIFKKSLKNAIGPLFIELAGTNTHFMVWELEITLMYFLCVECFIWWGLLWFNFLFYFQGCWAFASLVSTSIQLHLIGVPCHGSLEIATCALYLTAIYILALIIIVLSVNMEIRIVLWFLLISFPIDVTNNTNNV